MYCGVPLRTSAPVNSSARPANPKSVRSTAAAVQHYVARFQVAMQHSLIVCGRQSGTKLARNFQSFIRGQPTDPSQQRTEVFAVHVLHREKNVAIDFSDIVDAAHVLRATPAG